MISKIKGLIKQINISDEMKRIRERNSYNNIDKTLKETKEHYEKVKYENKDLFHRLSRLEIKVKFYEISISALIGILWGAAVLEKSNTHVVVLLLTSLTMAIIISLIIVFILNITSNAKKGYEQYLNEKEVEIIKNILEERRIKVKVKQKEES